MNSDHVQTTREALVYRRSEMIIWASVEDNESELARIDAALAALEEAAGWEMLSDGEYAIGGTTLLVCYDGQELEQWTTDNVYKDGSPKSLEEITLGEYRLFRKRQPAQEGDE